MRNRRLNQHVFGDQLHRAWALTGRTELSFDTRCSLPLLNTQAAKARGVKLGGTNAQSIANRSEANKHAKKLRPILTELPDYRRTRPPLSLISVASQLRRVVSGTH